MSCKKRVLSYNMAFNNQPDWAEYNLKKVCNCHSCRSKLAIETEMIKLDELKTEMKENDYIETCNRYKELYEDCECDNYIDSDISDESDESEDESDFADVYRTDDNIKYYKYYDEEVIVDKDKNDTNYKLKHCYGPCYYLVNEDEKIAVTVDRYVGDIWG